MIEAAEKKYKYKNLVFKRQNVLQLDERLGKFSVVLSTRCLINLHSWEEQKEALRRIHRHLTPFGRLILIEGTQQGRSALNNLRLALALKAMPPVWHNQDFDERKLKPFLKGLFRLEEDIRFGFYDVLTRVCYPKAIFPKEPQYGTSLHAAARNLTRLFHGDPLPQYSREFVMILKKEKHK